ncbi:MAG: hypothetical protein WAU53_06195 [Rhodoplanes sp.]
MISIITILASVRPAILGRGALGYRHRDEATSFKDAASCDHYGSLGRLVPVYFLSSGTLTRRHSQNRVPNI